MKRNLKEKGITLLALIITIVLLLIISGVTLNIAIGDNGLLNKSKEAVNKGKLAQTEEAIKMDLLAAYIDAEITGLSKPTAETIKEIIEKYGGMIDESNPDIIQTPNGEIRLDEILNETSSDTNNTEELNKTIANLNNRITELNRELETEKTAKEELQTQVNNLNGQVEELNTQVADWKKKAEDGEVSIAEKDTQISNLNSQITQKNEEIQTKTSRITQLEGSVETLTNEKTSLDAQIKNLNARIAELEGREATGDATVADVLAGKTFSTANGVNQTGTMINRGTINFNPDASTSQILEPGYYEGGTLSTINAYKNGYDTSKVNISSCSSFGDNLARVVYDDKDGDYVQIRFKVPEILNTVRGIMINYIKADSQLTEYVTIGRMINDFPKVDSFDSIDWTIGHIESMKTGEFYAHNSPQGAGGSTDCIVTIISH